MTYYAGIDVSLEYSSVCVVDGAGKIIREQRIASEPEALIAWFRGLGFGLERIGLEAGPLSQWLHAAMRTAGLAVELLETRHVRDAFRAMPVKNDRNDARGIAQLMRLGWFRPVHCKSMAAQEVRALLTARKLVQSKLLDVGLSSTDTIRWRPRADPVQKQVMEHCSLLPLWRPDKESSTDFGLHRTPAFPKRCPLAGTTDQVRPLIAEWHYDHALPRLVTHAEVIRD